MQPYVLDLGSANGTYVNNSRIEAQKYVQLLEKVKFHYIYLFYPILLYQSNTYLFDSVILCIFHGAKDPFDFDADPDLDPGRI